MVIKIRHDAEEQGCSSMGDSLPGKGALARDEDQVTNRTAATMLCMCDEFPPCTMAAVHGKGSGGSENVSLNPSACHIRPHSSARR